MVIDNKTFKAAYLLFDCFSQPEHFRTIDNKQTRFLGICAKRLIFGRKKLFIFFCFGAFKRTGRKHLTGLAEFFDDIRQAEGTCNTVSVGFLMTGYDKGIMSRYKIGKKFKLRIPYIEHKKPF